ncbi:hypothetical protein W824_11730 [Clavibacter cf. michiganensis LMG 26808]|nr:hypothetical protein W824_11730 [Clavibacter cf. michiganensis LMG 26808]
MRARPLAEEQGVPGQRQLDEALVRGLELLGRRTSQAIGVGLARSSDIGTTDGGTVGICGDTEQRRSGGLVHGLSLRRAR